MGRIIINNTAGVSDFDALSMVKDVLKNGMISTGRFGKQYCHLTTFTPDNGDAELRVWSTKTATGTFSFDVYIDAKAVDEIDIEKQ